MTPTHRGVTSATSHGRMRVFSARRARFRMPPVRIFVETTLAFFPSSLPHPLFLLLLHQLHYSQVILGDLWGVWGTLVDELQPFETPLLNKLFFQKFIFTNLSFSPTKHVTSKYFFLD